MPLEIPSIIHVWTKAASKGHYDPTKPTAACSPHNHRQGSIPSMPLWQHSTVALWHHITFQLCHAMPLFNKTTQLQLVRTLLAPSTFESRWRLWPHPPNHRLPEWNDKTPFVGPSYSHPQPDPTSTYLHLSPMTVFHLCYPRLTSVASVAQQPHLLHRRHVPAQEGIGGLRRAQEEGAGPSRRVHLERKKEPMINSSEGQKYWYTYNVMLWLLGCFHLDYSDEFGSV